MKDNVLQHPRPLLTIVQAMEVISTAREDELTHIEADDLLLEALKLMSNRFPQDRELVTRLIVHYKKIPKWYA